MLGKCFPFQINYLEMACVLEGLSAWHVHGATEFLCDTASEEFGL